MIKNKFGIKHITIKSSCKNYCPLGKDWYTNNFNISISPKDLIPDYCDIDNFIKTEINNKHFIIEEAINKLHSFIITKYKPSDCEVLSYVDDATHSSVIVEKN